jgi:hypothetical protein
MKKGQHGVLALFHDISPATENLMIVVIAVWITLCQISESFLLPFSDHISCPIACA